MLIQRYVLPGAEHALQCARYRACPPSDKVVVFLGGFLSDQLLEPENTRLSMLAAACMANAWDLVVFNYRCHGRSDATRSGGDWSDFSFSGMVRDAAAMLEACQHARMVVVASSLGAGLLPLALAECSEDCRASVQGVLAYATFTARRAESLILQHQPEAAQRPAALDLPVATLPQRLSLASHQVQDMLSVCRATEDTAVALTNARLILSVVPTLDPYADAADVARYQQHFQHGSKQVVRVEEPHDISAAALQPHVHDFLARMGQATARTSEFAASC
jgi:pimeloyl-ACP methyl ester carboxylesterase